MSATGFGAPLISVLLLISCFSTVTADGEREGEAYKQLVGMQLTINRQNNGGSEQIHANVFENEDAAAAAVRVCFETDNLDHGLVNDVHKHLQARPAPSPHDHPITPEPAPVAAQANLDAGNHKPKPEGVELLRTAGKYLKRAKEHAKQGDHQLGAADILRALQRKGLETDMRENMMRQLRYSFEAMTRLKKREAEEEVEQVKMQERKALEAVAMEEAKKKRAEDDADWRAYAAKEGMDLVVDTTGKVSAPPCTLPPTKLSLMRPTQLIPILISPPCRTSWLPST